MQLSGHDLLDYLMAPFGVVLAFFAKLTLDNDKRLAVMDERFRAIDEKLDDIQASLLQLK